MEESILNDVKQMLGIEPDDTSFDLDVRVHINSAFAQLARMSEIDFPTVTDASIGWGVIPADRGTIPLIKDYVYLYAKSLFDPPNTSFANEAIKTTLKELGWHISTTVIGGSK